MYYIVFRKGKEKKIYNIDKNLKKQPHASGHFLENLHKIFINIDLYTNM